MEYFLILVLYRFVSLIPKVWDSTAGSFLGDMAYFAIPRRREITLNNLRQAFKSKGFNHRKVARAMYRSLGMSVLEFLRALGQDRSSLLSNVHIEGWPNYEEALRQNRGVIFLCSHYGNWELMNLVHSAMGHPSYVVGREMDNPRLNRLLNSLRERYGSTVINSKDPSSLRQILSALHRKKTIAFLIDQSVVGDRGVYVDFFGRPAYTHKIVALMALKTGVPVVPVFIHRQENGAHCFSYEKALPLVRTGDREKDVWTNTQLMSRAVEDKVRQRPEQWLWMHDRWKKQPVRLKAAVFLDRDGTITREVEYIRDPSQIELLPRSAAGIRILNGCGIRVYVVTNQSGVARGFCSEDDVRRANDRMIELLKLEGASIDGIYYCPHHPEEGFEGYKRKCLCRKPEPGMLYQAVSEQGIDLSHSFVVGDKMTDVEMAARVGAKSILVRTGYGEDEIRRAEGSGLHVDQVKPDLEKAAEWIQGVIRRAGEI